MQKTNPMLKTVAVKNYLLQCICRAGMEPERLPGEMDLCEKFKVSRITIRRAIEELESVNYIIRLPGRKGAFTNPEMAQAVPHILGVIVADGKRNYFSSRYVNTMSGLTREIQDIYCDMEFVILNSSDPNELADELRNLAYDVLLWFSPPVKYVPILNTLIQEKYPILIHSSIFEEEKLPISNSVSYDFGSIGNSRANKLLSCGAKNIVYAGVGNSTFQCFVEELKKNGVRFQQANLIENLEDIPKKLPELLASGKIDSIVSDGGISRYHSIIQILKSNPEWQKINLFLEPRHVERMLQKRYPELSIHFCCSLGKNRYDFGKVIGMQFRKMLRDKQYQFENIRVISSREDQ